MNQKTPYWKAFLVHPANQALIAGVTAMGVWASVPWGLDALALAMLGLVAIEVVGLAVVTGLPSFRKAVDARERRASREARRARLFQEVEAHGGSVYLSSYQQMNQRVQSLYRTAADSHTALTAREVEQLDDLCVGYLAMCLSDAVMKQHERNDFGAVASRKLRGVEQDLNKADLAFIQEQQLRRAKAEYEEVLARHSRMVARRNVLEAHLVSMPVRMEEVYQMVLASPTSGDLGALLEESVVKLQAAEEVTLDVHDLFPVKTVPAGGGMSFAPIEIPAQVGARRSAEMINQRK